MYLEDHPFAECVVRAWGRERPDWMASYLTAAAKFQLNNQKDITEDLLFLRDICLIKREQ